MKKIIAFVLMLCLAGASSAFAYGGRHGGYYGGGYYERPHYSGGSRHHHNGVGIALGVVGGLLLGSALVNAAAPPPPAVVYETPRYAPPQVCVEDRVYSGEWRINNYDGRRVYVEYPYPVTRRVEVPCY